jgi:predicted Kef-type K+ transport protein
MDPLWLVVAFALGLAVSRIGLPPLVGFLAAGFVLKAFDVEGGETLERIGDLGVQLLLFSIGLKLQLRSLLRPQVWAVTSLHMLTTSLFFGLGIGALAALGVAKLAGIGWGPALLIGFALSFSSTVFAIKILEEMGESSALHGRMAVGILIMQDVFAIVFLMLSTGKVPTPWALLLLLLPVIRRILMKLMDHCGHGELLVLFGLLLPLGTAMLFELVSLKADLGALVAGLVIGGHPKSEELAKTLLGFKDLFLTGFFLSIGFYGPPAMMDIVVAVILTVLMPLKVILFFVLMTRFRLRARTSLIGSLNLANYSEFGLIVGAVGAKEGWIDGEWLVIIALALSFTFILASWLNRMAPGFYDRFGDVLRRWQTAERMPEDQAIDPGDARIAVFGMGRIGTAAYDHMRSVHGDTVVGVDQEEEVVAEHREAGRRVVQGDALDADFWQLAKERKIEVVMLAMPNQRENVHAAEQLRQVREFTGTIAAIAQYEDQTAALETAGADCAFNAYKTTGIAFAKGVCAKMEASTTPAPGERG